MMTHLAPLTDTATAVAIRGAGVTSYYFYYGTARAVSD